MTRKEGLAILPASSLPALQSDLALEATFTAVVDVHGEILLAAVRPLLVAIAISKVAGVLTLASVAFGDRIRQVHQTWRVAGTAKP